MKAKYTVDRVRETVSELESKSALASIRAPRDAAKVHQCDLADKREQFRVMILDTKNRVLEDRLISLGSLNAALVHPREVMRPAIVASAASLIIYHNHPSGDPTPSREDIEFARRMDKVGELVGIKILDHMVIGDAGRFVSFREKGYC